MMSKSWSTIHRLCVREDDVSREALQRLLELFPSDINLVTPLGSTALHLACLREDILIANMLIQHNANVNHVNKFQQTPLHYACRKGSVGLVEILLANGAIVTISDTTGKTPLQWAVEEERETVVSLLLRIPMKIP